MMKLFNKFLSLVIFFASLFWCQLSYGQQSSIEIPDFLVGLPDVDSIRQVRFEEVDFIIDQIENTYVSRRRGLNDEEWGRSIDKIYNYLGDRFYYWNEYMYVWRWLSQLTNDAHFAFPDEGMFYREKVFNKNDILIPLWVQTGKDGTVYNIKDYSGIIPSQAKILSINGMPAHEIALLNRSFAPGEEVYAMSRMNTKYEPDPLCWINFANFLHIENIEAPYEIIYSVADEGEADTVIINGITRGEKNKLYIKSGDKRRTKEELGFSRKPIVYSNKGDGIGVLAINSFWGKRWSHMLLFGKDWRYKRLLRQAMRRIDRDDINDLIIDVSLNSGGSAENVYYTLNYFTETPIDITQIYSITDNNRELAQKNVERSPHIPEKDREKLIRHIGEVDAGTTFCTDTIFKIQYTPDSPKHFYRGNVYVLTSHATYSAAQIFARYCQVLDIGPVAGQHCGGYNDVTGNAARVTLPSMSKMQFQVPFSVTRVCNDDKPFDYPVVDIPIEHSFDDWINRANNSLDILIDKLREEEF